MKFKNAFGNKFKPSEFSKNVAKLFTGSALANLIFVLTLPVLTRLYTKEDFGLFQLFSSTVLTISVIGSFKYEMTIVLPKSKIMSKRLFAVSVILLLVFTGMVSLLLYVFSNVLLNFLNAEQLQPYLLLMCISIFSAGLLRIAEYVWINEKKFSKIGQNRILKNSSTQSIAIGYGLLSPAFIGLVVSQITGQLISSFYILRTVPKKSFRLSFKQFLVLLRKHRKFALVNTPMVFLNTISLELPVYMFAKFFNPEVVGLYMVARRLIYRPLGLIGQSISQVYFQGAAEAFNNSPIQLMKLYKKTLQKLALVGLVPIAVVIIAGPEIMALFLGTEWREAGLFMQIMSFWIYFQFLNTPVSSTFSVINKQEIGFIIIIISVLIRFAFMYIFKDNYISMLWALSVSAGGFYLLYNIAIYLYIRSKI